jgi:hypothetical protein
MESFSRSQRLALVAAGIVVAIICLALTVYFGVAAAGHPRAKHMLLFIVLAIVGALIAWFAYPAGPESARRI